MISNRTREKSVEKLFLIKKKIFCVIIIYSLSIIAGFQHKDKGWSLSFRENEKKNNVVKVLAEA